MEKSVTHNKSPTSLEFLLQTFESGSGGDRETTRRSLESMRIHAQHGLACLPVTAIHVLECGESTFVLSNRGSSIVVRRIGNDQDLFVHRIFDAQNIHGISSYVTEQTCDAAVIRLVVWGGSKICLCTLSFPDILRTENHMKLSLTIVDQRDIGDWIMAVLMNERQPDPILLTAHNTIWCIESQPDLRLRSRLVAQGMRTLLYSADIVIADADNILVASGTVFGEVIFWTCFRRYETEEWLCKTKNVFLGHVGSVFGVSISTPIRIRGQTCRVLTSCSDDRTVRIWNVSDHERAGAHVDDKVDTLKETGFGAEHEQSLQLAMAWGHVSRIWDVSFLNAGLGADMKQINLVSRGEDATCQWWSLEIDGLFDNHIPKNSAMKTLGSDRHHMGKNIWSLATTVRGTRSEILTGGADGQIVSRTITDSDGSFRDSIGFRDIFNIISHIPARALKQYLIFDDNTVVATTDFGDVVKTRAGQMDKWAIITSSSERLPITLCDNCLDNLTFLSLSDKSLHAYNTETNRTTKIEAHLPSQISWMRIVYSESISVTQSVVYLVANLYGDHLPRLYVLTFIDQKVDSQVMVLQSPPDFLITSGFYDRARALLICGSRAGALAIFDTSDRQADIIISHACIRRVHGCDSVLSIMAVPDQLDSTLAESMHILTTGRDGTFAIHRVGSQISQDRLTRLETVHRSTPPIGPSIEGAYFPTIGGQDRSLLLYGFKSKEFVVWDETNQRMLLSIDCGGMHRSWKYSPIEKGVGTFVWTKAGTFNLHHESRLRHEVIQRGGHGREIKALAMFRLPACHAWSSSDDDYKVLLATGAEDTEIRLSWHSSTSILCTSVLKNHTTGLQALAFSSCGRYLFSSGGVEEFLVWRLNSIPVLHTGAVMIGQLTKTGEDDDARIMNFDVADLKTLEPGLSKFLIVMAYSNGKAKVVEFGHNESEEATHFTLTQQFNISTICLSQVLFHSMSASVSIIVGATDGFLRFALMEPSNAAVVSHRVHQSNIATMVVHTLNEKMSLVVTGGDDNALGLTRLELQDGDAHFQTWLVPKAHAAALTAVALVVDDATQQLYVLSAGNDQKVKLWQTTLDVESSYGKTNQPVQIHVETEIIGISLRKLVEISIDVADVSNMLVVHQGRSKTGGLEVQVVIVGVGMQTIHFEIET